MKRPLESSPRASQASERQPKTMPRYDEFPSPYLDLVEGAIYIRSFGEDGTPSAAGFRKWAARHDLNDLFDYRGRRPIIRRRYVDLALKHGRNWRRIERADRRKGAA